MDENKQRGQWGSTFGFLMASIGSAIGLGNLWGFPYKMGSTGGFAFLVVYLSIMGVFLLFALACWIMRSVSLHKIAKRRGIRHAWLAWLPLGREWVLGSVSDQYQHLVQGKITARRRILLILEVACIVVGIVYVATTAMAEIMAVADGSVGGILLAVGIPYLLFLGVAVTDLVFYHICNFDLYRSCNPQNAVVFLVLGIVLPVCQPFFYFACRKKDLGMVVPQPVTPEPAELPQANPEF